MAEDDLDALVDIEGAALWTTPFLIAMHPARRLVEPEFTPRLKEFLAKKGFDPQMGARPMARLIQDTIRKALADELLFGRLVAGGHVTIDVGDDEKVRLVFEERPEELPAEPVA